MKLLVRLVIVLLASQVLQHRQHWTLTLRTQKTSKFLKHTGERAPKCNVQMHPSVLVRSPGCPTQGSTVREMQVASPQAWQKACSCSTHWKAKRWLQHWLVCHVYFSFFYFDLLEKKPDGAIRTGLHQVRRQNLQWYLNGYTDKTW